jgi:hypothetical protein
LFVVFSQEKIKFMEGGERAVTNFEGGKAGLEARGFRGLGVFTSMPVRKPLNAFTS